MKHNKVPLDLCVCVPNKQDGPGQVEHARYQLANRLQRLSTFAMVGANGNPGGGPVDELSSLPDEDNNKKEWLRWIRRQGRAGQSRTGLEERVCGFKRIS